MAQRASVALLCMVLRPSVAPTVCDVFGSDVIVVGEDHSQLAGSATVGRLLAYGQVCGAPIDCVLLELDRIPEACSKPRPGACLRADLRWYQRRMLTPFLLGAARDAGATVTAIDHQQTYDSLDKGETMDIEWMLYGRNEWMAERVVASRCARAVVLVGYAHTEGKRSIPRLIEDQGFVTTTLRATCGPPSWDLRRSFAGTIAGRSLVPCDDIGAPAPDSRR